MAAKDTATRFLGATITPLFKNPIPLHPNPEPPTTPSGTSFLPTSYGPSSLQRPLPKTLVFGVRHHSAPIDVRERLSLSEADLEALHQAITAHPNLLGCAVLNTCNRTEIYTVVTDVSAGLNALVTILSTIKGVDLLPYQPYWFSLLDEDAAHHLLRVTSGLDSLIMGEGQILNQVKDTYQASRQWKTCHPHLERLFQRALQAGKRVRTETGLAKKDISISHAAYERLKQEMPDFLQKRLTLVGGGKMASLLLRALHQALPESNRHRVTLVNRSPLRLKELCDQYGFQGQGWDAVPKLLTQTDVLFVATGAPHVLLEPDDFKHATPMLVMDVSVPRNVDPAVGELPHITLLNTDDLRSQNPLAFSEQQSVMEVAERILDDELTQYRQWLQSQQAGQTIHALRHHMETLRQDYLSDLATEDTRPLDQASRRLVNRLFHNPLVALRNETCPQKLETKLQVLQELFGLTPDDF
ncbi:MAG: glutamyl-tRNA reductase [Vampirovibrionales bacterium]|nr:glutamyl-tRNA reductase [Vampirovibrionales bacterium]